SAARWSVGDFLVSGWGRWPRVHHGPRRADARHPQRARFRGAGEERARRRVRCVAGAGRRGDLHARISIPLQHWRQVNPDVIVLGGGPAGSTTSTLIAQRGHRVQLFERDRFPRFHIGESLIPETYWVLQRLNMLPKMQASHFVKKYSVQFVNSKGRESAP